MPAAALDAPLAGRQAGAMPDDRSKRRPQPAGPDAARLARLAAALRENLAKRKAQARQRTAQTPPKRDKTA